MLKKALTVLLAIGLVLAAIGYGLYRSNTAPILAPVAAADLANPARPYVVKMHAQWCPVCMITKEVWSEIEAAYAGRVNLVVFDFTTEATTAKSRTEAARLGLTAFIDEYGGATGSVVVLSGARTVLASIDGSRDFDAYRRVIDAALVEGRPAGPR